MTLQAALTQQYHDLHLSVPPEVSLPIKKAAADNKATFKLSSTIQVGDRLPVFTLPDATGKRISSTPLLAKGPLLITFYRGSWSPFCNLALRAFQSALTEISEKGVSFLAITAELPDTSVTTIEKEGLKYPVLSDVGNVYAKQLVDEEEMSLQ